MIKRRPYPLEPYEGCCDSPAGVFWYTSVLRSGGQRPYHKNRCMVLVPVERMEAVLTLEAKIYRTSLRRSAKGWTRC